MTTASVPRHTTDQPPVRAPAAAPLTVPVVITRPRYVLTPRGQAIVDATIAHAVRGGPVEQWYARVLTGWREAMTWASQAPEELGPPPGVTVADMEPPTDRLRMAPLPMDAQATFPLRDHLTVTIADPYQRMLVALGQEASSTPTPS